MLANICSLSSGTHAGVINITPKSQILLDMCFVDDIAGSREHAIFSVNVHPFFVVPQYHAFPVRKVRQIIDASLYFFGPHVKADSEQARKLFILLVNREVQAPGIVLINPVGKSFFSPFIEDNYFIIFSSSFIVYYG